MQLVLIWVSVLEVSSLHFVFSACGLPCTLVSNTLFHTHTSVDPIPSADAAKVSSGEHTGRGGSFSDPRQDVLQEVTDARLLECLKKQVLGHLLHLYMFPAMPL